MESFYRILALTFLLIAPNFEAKAQQMMDDALSAEIDAYVQKEMDLLDKGVYGVEDFHTKVDAYLDYLREVVA